MVKTTLGGVFQKDTLPVATRGQQKLNMCSLKLMLDKKNTVKKTEWALFCSKCCFHTCITPP